MKLLSVIVDVETGRRKIDDKVSFWKGRPLEDLHIFNQFSQLTFHFISTKLDAFRVDTMPAPKFLVSHLDAFLLSCRPAELFL